ncbi:MAG: division/cell wall cluster transcriptional repressor MraZ [Ruminococcaceae bacterium]|nr:division/cell wall cluster transcriptional repressor MraZ [Oscillospiraceae bacterium]
MFYGQAKHSIDAKGRVILPSKYRENLGESFFVLRGFEKCLFVYTQEDYKELEAKIKALPISNDGGRLQRYIFNYTELVTADKQGRFVIPPGLREFAGLNKDIIIAGASSRIEIWDVEEYEKYEKQTEDEPQKLSEILNIFGI